jgi:hypothetical protein
LAKNLITTIGEDKVISRENKPIFSAMAVKFEEDLFENIDLTSMELFQKYREITESASLWQKFLAHKPVKDYIQSFVNEKASKAARLSMVNPMKASEAVKVADYIAKNEVKEDNSSIVVMLMPQKSSWSDGQS